MSSTSRSAGLHTARHRSSRLLTRDAFREAVFARDGHQCVVRDAACVPGPNDAHHVIERRLWPDGGYYLDNGVTLCGVHHRLAEQTVLSVEDLRKLAKIERALLPETLVDDTAYDKWGNPLLATGQRLRGPLFEDEQVQRILAEGDVLRLFGDRVKYPRTPHFSWSAGAIPGKEAILRSLTRLTEEPKVIVTAKMDGECTTLYADSLHARSVDGASHPSQSRMRAWHAANGHNIPDGWRVVVENLSAQHTIAYRHLAHYFLVTSVWTADNVALSWEETTEWAALLGLPTAPVLYEGPWHLPSIRACEQPTLGGDPLEGYVVRPARRFTYGEFAQVVGKYVSPAFEQQRAALAGVPRSHRTVVWNQLASAEG